MKIDSYKFGQMVINRIEYNSDLIVFQDKVKDKWWRKEGHELNFEDISDVLFKQKPDILIVGTGWAGKMNVSDEVAKKIRALGIELIAKSTSEAVKIFNELVEKQREKVIVAAFHLTC
jgi:hypothetical protein